MKEGRDLPQESLPVSKPLKNLLLPRLLNKVQMSLDSARDRERFDRLTASSSAEGPPERQGGVTQPFGWVPGAGDSPATTFDRWRIL